MRHGPERQVDRGRAVAAIELVQGAVSIFEPLFRGHLEGATLTTRQARVGIDDYSTVPLAVGFVDLSGFTARSAALSAPELLDLVVEFEAAAVDLVSRHGGRLVKLIGDEVMFTTVAPEAACAIGRQLIEWAATSGTGARAGIAHGLVITLGGHVYGDTVNLASRLTDVAVPGEMLVNEAVATADLAPTFEAAGRRQLKGFTDPVRLWSLQVG